jgi:hypothetical protein
VTQYDFIVGQFRLAGKEKNFQIVSVQIINEKVKRLTICLQKKKILLFSFSVTDILRNIIYKYTYEIQLLEMLCYAISVF